MEYRKVEGELGVSKLPIIAVRRGCVSVGSKGGGVGAYLRNMITTRHESLGEMFRNSGDAKQNQLTFADSM